MMAISEGSTSIGSKSERLTPEKAALFRALTGHFDLPAQTGLTKIGMVEEYGLDRIQTPIMGVMKAALCDDGLLVAFAAKQCNLNVLCAVGDGTLVINWQDADRKNHVWVLRPYILRDGGFGEGITAGVKMPVKVMCRGTDRHGSETRIAQLYVMYRQIGGDPIASDTVCSLQNVRYYPAGTSLEYLLKGRDEPFVAATTWRTAKMAPGLLGLLSREFSIECAQEVFGAFIK